MLAKAAGQGFEPRIADASGIARKKCVLLLHHMASAIDINLSLGILPFEVEMVERSSLMKIGTVEIRLPAPDDLLIMKAIAHRIKDRLISRRSRRVTYFSV
ncbi:MAG TPA: hypothetical protein VLH85_09900 [Levilinea sp.]|nr:hypothetical protein [Levilinea sp.]